MGKGTAITRSAQEANAYNANATLIVIYALYSSLCAPLFLSYLN